MRLTQSPPMAPPPEFSQAARAFEEQFSYVYRAVRRFGVPAADVEDLVQEVFLVMWRRWHEYEQHRPLRPWLAGIAFNISQKHMSRGRREVPRGEIDREDESPHPDERLSRARSRELALRALAALPAKQRAILVMHDLDGQEMRDIAGELAVPLFTAYSRLRRARIGFARAVQELQSGEPAVIVDVSSGRRQVAVGAGDVLASEQPLPQVEPEVYRRARRRFGVAALATPAAGGGAAARQPGPTTAAQAGAPEAGWGLARVLRTLVWGALAPAAVALIWAAAPRHHPPRATTADAAPVGTSTAPATAATAPAPRRPRPAALFASALVPSFARPAPGDAAPAHARAELNRGLSAYFRFDDGYGSTSARDLSMFGRDCRMHQLDPNGAWTEGQLGGALDVGRGFLECPQPAELVDDSAELSVSAWVRLEAARNELVAVVARQVAETSEDHFILGVVHGGQLKMRSDLWKTRVTANPRRRVPLQRWTHVGFTRAADGTVRLYMNGSEIARTSQRYGGRPASAAPVYAPLTIGAGIDGPNLTRLAQKLPGAVDEVAIYDRALTPGEMAALAHGEQPRLSP
jgi:RNA polymerase sigma factor (sigma-70 family)